ncbi:MAG: S-layer homology domain-containing protein [Synergistaceae bacterium]|nr:S-layer homology domain-containing protein [Synergistaceae bacterium]
MLAVAAPVFAATNPFMDVPLNHWAYDAIGQLAAKGILSGYPDGTYKGKQPTTRYEMASALARALAVVDMTKASKQDVEMLKKLVVEFKDELDALGVKVDTFDARLKKIEGRLGGWKLGGSIRFDFYNLSYDSDDLDDLSGAAFARTRLEIQRWFGEDEGMHLYIRINDGQDLYTKVNTITFNKLFIEVPVWWDSTLTVGRFAWDMESAYYLNGTTNFSENMGHGQDSWLTDRTVDGLGWRKSFGLGRVSAYVAKPTVTSYFTYDTAENKYTTYGVGAWELFVMGELQFTEKWGFDIGAQYFAGDDRSKVGDFEFDSMWTVFAGLRFNFNNNIELKGLFYYQDADVSVAGRDVDIDSASAFRAIIDVKQSLLKFTSLWLEYDYLEENFVIPNGGALVLGGTEPNAFDHGESGIPGSGTPSVMWDDLSIWRIGAKQVWNDKFTTLLYVSNYSFDETDASAMHYAIGLIYKYNPNVQFGLVYSAFDSDDELKNTSFFKDPSVIRFRTFISF